MNDKGLVSVIITCYNQAHCIERTLNSVLNQKYQNWEAIVVDDGSNDGSVENIKAYCERDKRIILVSQKNFGVSIARNNGFKVAKGAYIQFLDGDDTLHPQKLLKQIAFFKENPSISVCCVNHRHYFESTNVYKEFVFERLKNYPLEQLLYGWQNGVAFPPHAMLYKREIWGKNELPFASIYKGRSEDWIFNVSVALKGCEYGVIDEVLCDYNIADLNFTNSIEDSCVSAIQAAVFLETILPEKYKTDILDFTIRKSLKRYLDRHSVEILHRSNNWKLGYSLTYPLMMIHRFIRRLFNRN